jgi:peptidoglycan/LPS O-acetylase OafA/YrhL
VVHVAYIDGLRAVAVLSVLAFHTAISADGRPADWAICGSRGVVLFFVISGFCLAFPFLRAWRARGTFELDYAAYGRFLLRRLSRIAPPFYAAIVIFGILAATPFGFPTAEHQDASFGSALRDFFGNLTFLTSARPIFNASFWTLGIEARWYLLCPLLIALYVRSRLIFAAVAALMYGLYFFTPFSLADEGSLPCFMAGIFAADVALARPAWCRYAWIAAACFLGLAVLQQSGSDSGDLANPLWHAACFFLVVAGNAGVVARLLSWKPLAYVGIASYSIYLFHEPFVTALARSGVSRPIAAVAGLGIGLAAYRFIERPLAGEGFRGALERAISAPARLFAKPRLVEPRA